MTRIKLTESELKEQIAKCITEALEDEGLMNQLKQGAKSFFGNGYGKNNPNNFRNTIDNRRDRGEHTANKLNGTTPLNLKGRWNAAKTGYKEQGNVDNANEVISLLKGLINNGTVTPEMTVRELINKMTGNRLSAQKRTSKANNEIYRGMQTGVMGSGKTQTI